MGQHKHNPIAIAAKNGILPPKSKKPSKREREFMVFQATENACRRIVGVAPTDLMGIYTNGFYK